MDGTAPAALRFHNKDCALRRHATATKCSCGIYERRSARGAWKKSLSEGQRTRWTGRLGIPATAHPLVKNLFAIMNREGIGINHVNAVANFSKRTLSEIRYSQSPSIAVVVAAYNAIGRDLAVVDRVAGETAGQKLMAKILNTLRAHEGSWIDHSRLAEEIYLYDVPLLAPQKFRAACRGLIRLGFPVLMKKISRNLNAYRFQPLTGNETRLCDLMEEQPSAAESEQQHGR